MNFYFLLSLVLGASAFVKRDVGSHHLFTPGQEFLYDFCMWTQASSRDYVAFGSTFNITGDLHVATVGSNINVRLDNVKFGAHNGEFDMLNKPVITKKAYDQLSPLSEPFSIQVSEGLVQGIILNDAVEKWSHNIKRGIATVLQLDLARIDLTKSDQFYTDEETVVGDCKTHYLVIPKEDDNHTPLNKAQVSKFRTSEDCANMPRRVRKPGFTAYYVPNEESKSLLTTSGYATYDLETQGGNLLVKKIHGASSLLHNLFGANGHVQYSHAGFEMKLKSSNSGSVPGPANAKTYNDLKFKFEKDIKEDEDIRSPQPFFFHHKGQDLDSAGQTRAIDQLVANIKKVHESLDSVAVYDDIKKFHKVGPFSLIPLVGALDYEHLKEAYNRVKDGNEIEHKLFLDAVVVSGTGPAALLIRDIVAATTDHLYVTRTIAPLPNYIRNPTENLLKEFEPLIKPDNDKFNGRTIELAFASMMGRTCKKTNCQSSGLLNKWVKFWSDKIDSSTVFDERTHAIHCLRNVDHEVSAMKLLTVFKNKKEDRTVRSAAIFGLTPLFPKNIQIFKTEVLPTFYDRQEDSELRNQAFQLTLFYTEEANMYSEVVIFMWSETNPEVKNFVKSTLQGLAASTRTVFKKSSALAAHVLQWYPPWEIKSKFSGAYMSDYFDPEFNFGHSSLLNVQKNGNSILPRTAYISFNSEIAGYNTKPLSVRFRLEGVGQAVASRLMSITTGVIEFDYIKELFEKIGVEERKADPLRIEVEVMLHGRIVGYLAADDKSVMTFLQSAIKKIGELKSVNYEKDWVRMMLIGAVTTEQPNEIGIPVSTVNAVSAIGAIHAKVGSEKAGTTVSKQYDIRLQFNMHAISAVNNHLPPFGTAHSVEAARTMRIRLPRKISIGVDMKQHSLNFVVSAPTETDPVRAQVHATAVTAVHSDAPAALRDQAIVDLLHETCPQCKGVAVISKGEKLREERKLGSGYKYKFMEGVNAGAKYYDCEKIHSRIHVLKQLRKFYGPENKNLGGCTGRALTTLRLGTRYLLQTIFLSPPTETCGMQLWYSQDSSAQSVFDRAEGQAKVKIEEYPKDRLGTKVMLKSSVNFKYTGPTPKTKSLDIAASLTTTGLEKTEINTKFLVKDDSASKQAVLCIDDTTQSSKISDLFAYDGEDEPTSDRTVNIAWAKDAQVTKDGACPANADGVKIVRTSHRSQAQKEAAQSNAWPYKQCRDHKASPKYPGEITPATNPCLLATYKQTALRESNVTITYKVDPDARKRWRYPGALVAAFLMQYAVPSDSVDGHPAHGHHGIATEGQLEGEIKLDIAMDEEHPTADIHWHGSQGEQEHFQGVDLSFLPGPLNSKIHSRFSGLMYTAFDLGLYSYCDVTPHAIQTYDDNTYYADLTDCYTLLTGDCSDKPRYVVLGKKVSNETLGIKVLTGEHEVELTDMNNVIIDGISHPIAEKILFPEGGSKLFKVYKPNDRNILITSRPLSLAIGYTGHYTTVTVGSRYRSTNCGLCGNFNGCPKDDFIGPAASCKNVTPTDMTKAFIVREGSCTGVGSACP